MTAPKGVGEIDLLVTDVPEIQREQVIRIYNHHVQRHELAGRVVMIARKLGKLIERTQRVEGWEGGLTALAMDYLVTGCCQGIYSEALRLQSEADKGGVKNGSDKPGRSKRGGSGGKGSGG